MDPDEIAKEVVDAAIRLHKCLGPGLLESAYLAALCIELDERGLRFTRELAIGATYRGKPLGVAFRADVLVENSVLVVAKSVQKLESIHTSQLLSYLRLAELRLGLLLNFNVPLMKSGIKRVVNNL